MKKRKRKMPKTKKEFEAMLAKRMGTTEKEAAAWVDAYTESLIDVFKTGAGVTITGLGGFYCEARRNGVAFKFNPSQRIRKVLGWSSTYKGD
ncbi:MAG: HU family DNA-binding protein [Bacteroidales bacterium]|nr:HU family DNA-binding protein [Bacteroidales bacterium]